MMVQVDTDESFILDVSECASYLLTDILRVLVYCHLSSSMTHSKLLYFLSITGNDCTARM